MTRNVHTTFGNYLYTFFVSDCSLDSPSYSLLILGNSFAFEY